MSTMFIPLMGPHDETPSRPHQCITLKRSETEACGPGYNASGDVRRNDHDAIDTLDFIARAGGLWFGYG